MRTIAQLLPGAFLVFASLKDSFEPDEKKEIVRFAL
jgi:hypothetical protein